MPVQVLIVYDDFGRIMPSLAAAVAEGASRVAARLYGETNERL